MFWVVFLGLCLAAWLMTSQKMQPKREEDASKPPPSAAVNTVARVVTVMVFSPIAAFLALFVSSCVGGDSKDASGGALSESSALTMCQMAIRGALIDSDGASIPYVENMGKGGEFFFAWGASTRKISAKNKAGLEAPVSASCSVDAASKSVTSLSINGKTIR